MRKIKAPSTRKLSAKEPDYLPFTQDKVGKALLTAQAHVFKKLNRFARGDYHAVEDAVSYGMAETIAALAVIAVDQDIIGSTIEERLEAFMLTAANRELGRIQRMAKRTSSLDAPLGDEDDDESFTMGAILAYRSDSPSHMENHADAMKAIRAASCLGDDERETLMGMIDGLTAEQCAKLEKIDPGQVRMNRARMLNRLREVWGRT